MGIPLPAAEAYGRGMLGSAGAVSATMTGRGNRLLGQDADDYRVSLPTIPTGRSVLNTVFIHADVRARPYRVEEFRDMLAHLTLLPEVVALGAYQMNHVWAVTFKDDTGVKRMLSCDDVRVKERRCIVIDPANQDVRLKIHWLLHNVPDDDVGAALAPYGRVIDVSRERWRARGVQDKGSTTRSVTLRLKSGVRADDLPHQLRVAGEQALVVVPGRAPQCLRCSGTGHMRRDCKVPRCTLCHRFGHEANGCVRTYAKVAGPREDPERTEDIMDEGETEEVAAGGGNDHVVAAAPQQEENSEKKVEALAEFPALASAVKPEQSAIQAGDAEGGGPVNVEDKVPGAENFVPLQGADNSNGDDDDQTLPKKPRQEKGGMQGGGDGSGLVKVSAMGTSSRRSGFKSKPSTPYDRGPAASKSP